MGHWHGPKLANAAASICPQGDFGLKCLSRVHPEYGSDAFFMRQFYEHVQKVGSGMGGGAGWGSGRSRGDARNAVRPDQTS